MNFLRIISVEVITLRTLLSLLPNFKIEIGIKQSKTLASGNYDSGRGNNPPKPTKIDVTFNLHFTEHAALKKKVKRTPIHSLYSIPICHYE